MKCERVVIFLLVCFCIGEWFFENALSSLLHTGFFVNRILFYVYIYIYT